MWGYQSLFESFELKNGTRKSKQAEITTDKLDQLYARVAKSRGVDSLFEG